MKSRKIKFLFLAYLTLLILGCHKDKVDSIIDGEDETSAVSFRLQTDETLTVVPLTRSGGNTPVDNDFLVRIENTRGEMLKTWKYAELPSLIKVVPGSYKLVASYGTDSILPAFEKPYYYGETKITLKEGDNLDTLVYCSIGAVKVAVEFDKSFGYEYQDYWVDIKTVGDSLSFAKNESRVAYFKPGNLRMRFVLKPVGSDTYYQFYPPAVGAVKAKEFYKMKLKANTDKGDLKSITITTDSSTIDIPVDVELPPFYLPKPAPKVTPQGFASGETIETTEGLSKPATVMVASSAGLTELKIKTVSDTLIARGWPEEIDLMQAAPEQIALLKANGLEWSKELNTKDTIKTTVWVKFDHVVRLLNTAPGQTSRSAFEVVAKDRFGQSGDAECKLNVDVAPPVFEFASAPGVGNVYARKAVYHVKYESEVRTPVVEGRVSNGNWITLNTKLSPIMDNSFECIGEGLIPNTDYAFRLRLGQHLLDAGNFQTEETLQVPNAGMENWYRENGKVWTVWFGAKPPYWFYWYPWNKDDVSTQGWNTINLKTTNIDWKYQYNSISGTMQTDDKHNGSYAALIRTVGWGSSNAAVGSANASNIDPGYLYLGSYDSGTKSPDYGYSFTSRPSSLACYYKYQTKDDRFLAEIVVQNRNGDIVTELGRGSFQDGTNVDAYSRLDIPVVYNKENAHLRATHIYILFKSGDKTDNSTLIEVPTFGNLSDGKYVGSQLYIDDIELIYE